MSRKSDEYNVIRSRIEHVGRFDIICDTILKDGQEYPYSYVQIRNCAAVLCIKDGSVLLLRQYRHTLKEWEYEIPAGSVEKDEDPYEAAKREVREETGYAVEKMLPLGWYHLSVGSTTEKVFLFQADCSDDRGQKLEALEKIELYTFTFEEFESLIAEGIFHQCMGVTAWERYKEISKIEQSSK